jgi:hypothetical protein
VVQIDIESERISELLNSSMFTPDIRCGDVLFWGVIIELLILLRHLCHFADESESGADMERRH